MIPILTQIFFEMGWVQPSTRSMLDSFLNDSKNARLLAVHFVQVEETAEPLRRAPGKLVFGQGDLVKRFDWKS